MPINPTSVNNHNHNGCGSLLKRAIFFLIGILIILVPLFTLFTIDNIKTHNKRTIEQLTDRGMALICSFEAGTRTGVGIMQWGVQRLQWLLTETARQHEIEYILITDRQGKILIHSNPNHSREIFHQMPDLRSPGAHDNAGYRQIKNTDGHEIFEVFKKFTPERPWTPILKTQSVSILPPPDHFEDSPQDWCRLHFFCNGRTEAAQHYIFAGLRMKTAKDTQLVYFRHVVLTGVLFFLIGCAGIFALFVLLTYRTAGLSSVRFKAFSDEVVANMPVGLITFALDGAVTSCNQAGLEILNRISGEKRVQTPASCPTPLRDVVEQVMATNRNVTTEVEFTGLNNRSIRLDVSASPIREQNGQISGYLLLFKNLTHIKSLESQVSRNNRLAAIGKLAAGVAHEIRNPLSSIKGLATYFKENLQDSPHDLKTAETLINEVERLNIAVSQLLEFAHPISLNTVDISPQELVSHSLRLIEKDLTAGRIRCRPVILTKKDVIATDQDRVTQILLNLYLNAIQAMDKSGILTVTVADTDMVDEVLISVADNGKGIAAEDLEHIFDPYFTNRNDSTGLGLAIAYKLSESLGGEISVESVVGQGTDFYIRLPVVDKER